MQDSPINVIEHVRQLMPLSTMNMMRRPLTKAEAQVVAERQAGALVRLLGITKPSVDIELVAELPNIEVEVVEGLPNSGVSEWMGRDRWLVKINADDSLWRCRSSLAHEIKHILDDPFRELLYPDWRRDDPHSPDEAEDLSDYFAGCLLVPKAWLYQAWEAGVQSRSALASLFDVSDAMISVRLRQTGLWRKNPGWPTWHGYHQVVYRRRNAKSWTPEPIRNKSATRRPVALRGGCPL